MEHDTAYEDRQKLIEDTKSVTGNTLSQIEATCQWYDEQDRWWEENPSLVGEVQERMAQRSEDHD